MRIGLIVVGLIALLALLKWQFPYAAQGEMDVSRIMYLVLIIVLVAAGGRFRQMKSSVMLRNSAIWLGIIILLVTAYSFRNNTAYNQLIGELLPSRARVNSEGAMEIRSDAQGHFHVEGEVNGAPVRFLIDTGATDIVLSPEDAARAGIDTETLNFSRQYETANGMVKGAPIRIQELHIGTILRRDEPASVNGASMSGSLLGMRFLNSLSGYSVDGNVMILKP